MPEPLITTYTGKCINPLTDDFSSLELEDFIYPLSRISRFGGHQALEPDIKVLEHVVRMCRIAPEEYKLMALCHEFGEAIFGDILTAIKYHIEFKNIKKHEHAAQERAYSRFGIEVFNYGFVKDLDNMIVREEAAIAMLRTSEDWTLPYDKPTSFFGDPKDYGWSPERCRKEFRIEWEKWKK